MPKPQIEPNELPNAIRWETVRLHYYRHHGFDTTEIERLLSLYTSRAFSDD